VSVLVTIYTDGACSKNPGPGGWGALLLAKDTARFISGFVPQSTNNRMELQAAIEALKALKISSEVELHTDSQYVKNGIQKWIHTWQRRNWINSANKPVLNRELWEQLIRLEQTHHVRWNWVQGHADNKYNNFVDKLATDAIKLEHGVDNKIEQSRLEEMLNDRQVSRRLRKSATRGSRLRN
jgi:ribonuclease HI